MSIKDTITINGRRYDIITGLPLAEHAQPIVEARIKPEIIKKPAAKKSSASVNHTKPHNPAHSKLLMRQAVKKPGPSLKRQIKTSAALDSHSRPRAIQPAAHHYQARPVHAKALTRSQSLSHYPAANPVNHYLASSDQPKPSLDFDPTHAAQKHVASQVSSKRTITSKELLDRALRGATAHEQPLMPKPHRRNRAKAQHFFSRLRTV
jgi:hypothetical protein